MERLVKDSGPLSSGRRRFLQTMAGAMACAPLYLAPALAKAPASPLRLIENVRVFDGASEHLSDTTKILIDGDMIREVSPYAEAPERAQRFDGGGRIIMPGLIDNHVHLQWNQPPYTFIASRPSYVTSLMIKECEATLMRGFTSVRDTGGGVQGVVRAIDEGLFPGPRIQGSAAAIGMTAGHGDYRSRVTPPRQLGGPALTELEIHGITVMADGVAECLTAAREQFRQGANFLKIFVGGAVSGLYDPLDIQEYSREEIRVINEEAKRWNSYSAVHAYTDQSIRVALEEGIESIEHANLMTAETLALLVEKDAWFSAQIAVFALPFGAGFSEAQRARQKQVMDGLDKTLTLARQMKAKIAFGTDLIGDPKTKALQNEEFTFRRQWFSDLEILQQATSVNARLFAMSGPRNPYQKGPLGVVQEGAYADLLVVEGNPLDDIGLLAKPEENLKMIMKGGVVYKNML